jgi:UDP-glucose 4-epimerase
LRSYSYGIPERLPITEATTQNPVNPYGYTKLAVESPLRDAEAVHVLACNQFPN